MRKFEIRDRAERVQTHNVCRVLLSCGNYEIPTMKSFKVYIILNA